VESAAKPVPKRITVMGSGIGTGVGAGPGEPTIVGVGVAVGVRVPVGVGVAGSVTVTVIAIGAFESDWALIAPAKAKLAKRAMRPIINNFETKEFFILRFLLALHDRALREKQKSVIIQAKLELLTV
jgi:hypothetical protein